MASVTGARLSAILLLLSCPARAAADTLKITSTPPGATVEIDGVRAGTTPFETDYPGGYLHKTKTSMGSRLEHPMVARVSLAGYVTKEVRLTDGPMNWISINGRNRGEKCNGNRIRPQRDGPSGGFASFLSQCLIG